MQSSDQPLPASPLTEGEIQQLAELEAQATAAPWHECGGERGGCQCRWAYSTSADWPVVSAHGVDEWGETPQEVAHANLALVVALRNALPRLLADRAALLARAEAAENYRRIEGRETNKLRDDWFRIAADLARVTAERDALAIDAAVMSKALNWYATARSGDVWADGGRCARAALYPSAPAASSPRRHENGPAAEAGKEGTT